MHRFAPALAAAAAAPALAAFLVVTPSSPDDPVATRPTPDPRLESDERAEAQIQRMLTAMGGKDRLRTLRDVEYRYTYRRVGEGTEDVSLERYIFDGELSWARYDKHEVFVMPGTAGSVTSSFDGETTVSNHGGKPVADEQAAGVLSFLRKTNYYWFCMFFKLADPGVNLKSLGKRTANHIEYDIVQVSFGDDIGDSPDDRYVLYLNPYTHLVDMFLFNVTAFGIETPLLMQVKYTMVDGTLLPVWRMYRPAKTWDTHEVVADGPVVLELSEDVRFNNGFRPRDFAPEVRSARRVVAATTLASGGGDYDPERPIHSPGPVERSVVPTDDVVPADRLTDLQPAAKTTVIRSRQFALDQLAAREPRDVEYLVAGSGLSLPRVEAKEERPPRMDQAAVAVARPLLEEQVLRLGRTEQRGLFVQLPPQGLTEKFTRLHLAAGQVPSLDPLASDPAPIASH